MLPTLNRFEEQLLGIDRVRVDFGARRVIVAFDPSQVSVAKMKAVFEESGKSAGTKPTQDHGRWRTPKALARQAEIRDLGRRVGFGAILTTPVVLTVMLHELFSAQSLPDFLPSRWFQLGLG